MYTSFSYINVQSKFGLPVPMTQNLIYQDLPQQFYFYASRLGLIAIDSS